MKIRFYDDDDTSIKYRTSKKLGLKKPRKMFDDEFSYEKKREKKKNYTHKRVEFA